MTTSNTRQFKLINQTLKTCASINLIIFLLTSLSAITLAQTASRPDRGVRPVGSYSVSDIENINMTNGNVNLSIPLAAMPPMAGGALSWILRAEYSSKLWDKPGVEIYQASPLSNYTLSTLQLGDGGGWRIGGTYNITIHHRDEDYQGVPPADSTDPNWYLTGYRWKMILTTPDGAKHELRPVDYPSYPGGTGNHDYQRGYYKDTPAADSINATMRYYSFDGSYLWAKIEPFPAGGGPQNWTVYLPDGTKVVEDTGVQILTDPNGNSNYIYTVVSGTVATTHYNGGYTGREITYTYNSATNTGQVQYPTVGGSLVSIDVNYGTTSVHGMTYQRGDPCLTEGLVDTEISIIRSIIYPLTKPGAPRLQYTFSYNSDTTDSVSLSRRLDCQPNYQTINNPSHGWGSLSRMVTPLGATVDYSYQWDGNHLQLFDPNLASGESIKQKKVTHNGIPDTWDYAFGFFSSSVTGPDKSVTTEVFYSHDPALAAGVAGSDGKGGLVYRTNRSDKIIIERHWTALTFSGGTDDGPGGRVGFNTVVDAEYTTLKENGQAIKMSAKTFQYDYNGNVTQTTEYDWFDPSLVSRDSAGVPTGVPGSATVLRVTNNSYYNQATISTSANVYAKRALPGGTPLILNAPRDTIVGASQTRVSYDGQAFDVAPTFGNLTKVSQLDDSVSPSQWRDTTYGYDSYGNRTTITDPSNNVTNIVYDTATNSRPTQVTVNPLNGTGAQTTTTAYDYWTGLVTSQTDPNNQTTDTDYTNQLLGTPDPFMRPGVVTGPPVTSYVNGVTYSNQRHKTRMSYSDDVNLPQVIVESDLNTSGDYKLKARTTVDQLGRTTLVEKNEDGTANYIISAQTVYVTVPYMGTVTKTTNPKRSAAATTDGWTRATSDLLGRVIEVATFSGTSQPPDTGTGSGSWTGSVTTSYYANQTTVTDQAGKVRRSVADGLGRLTQVIEDPNGLNYQTNYTYDTLGNLRKVEQGAQNRFFMYDSLSRLIRARNPEQDVNTNLNLTDPITSNSQWAMKYTYQANGNLATRVDARNITTTYGYDGLNRNIWASYNDGVTPVLERHYDGAISNGKGRLNYHVNYTVNPATGAGAYSRMVVGGYDAMGRVTSQSQGFLANDGVTWKDFAVSRTYDLAGHALTQGYPSSRSVSYSYAESGRLSSAGGNLGGASYTYADTFEYNAAGLLLKERFGATTNLYHRQAYNNRFQMIETRLGTSASDSQSWDRGALIFYYSKKARDVYQPFSNQDDNSGNVMMGEHYVPVTVSGSTVTSYAVAQRDRYEYEALNRIQSVTSEQMTTGGSWSQPASQTFTYDRWGNRTNVSGYTSQSWDTAEGAATNRLKLPSGNNCSGSKNGICYDSAGNAIFDNQLGAGGDRTYDAENRVISGAGGGLNKYVYDADGRRVRRQVGAQQFWQVYGIEGELIAEYEWNGTTATLQKEYGYRNGELLIVAENSATVRWLVKDHLGTPRMIADQSGGLGGMRRHDYLPFGEENLTGSVRTAGNGYQAEGVRQKFGSKERDTETGLDYFGARYFASVQGRFTGVDPLNPILEYRDGMSDDEENEKKFRVYLVQPQNWNRYSYVINNPLALIDPDGREGGYAYMPDGRMIAPGDPNYPRSNTPVKDTLLIAGVTVIGIFAPEAIPAVIRFVARNPATVLTVGQEMVQMSQGNPMSAPRLGVAQVEALGRSIGQSAMRMERGQIATIAAKVTESGLGQMQAVTAIQAAIKTIGKNSVAVPQANGTVVVASVMAGANKGVLIVKPNGVVSSATATINAGVRNGKPFFEVTDIVPRS